MNESVIDPFNMTDNDKGAANAFQPTKVPLELTTELCVFVHGTLIALIFILAITR